MWRKLIPCSLGCLAVRGCSTLSCKSGCTCATCSARNQLLGRRLHHQIQSYRDQRRISFLELFANHCINLTHRSPDPSTKVGCVIFDKDGCILAQGYNGEIAGGFAREAPDGVLMNLPLENEVTPKDLVSFRVPTSRATVFVQVPRSTVETFLSFPALYKNDNQKAEDIQRVIGVSQKQPFNSTQSDNSAASASRVAKVALSQEAEQWALRARTTQDAADQQKAEETAKRAFHAKIEQSSSTGGDDAIHAEINAITYAGVPPRQLRDSIAMVSLMPCPQCYKMLTHLGVKYIIVLSDAGRYIGSWKQAEGIAEKNPIIVPFPILIGRINSLLKAGYESFREKGDKTLLQWEPGHMVDTQRMVFKESIPMKEGSGPFVIDKIPPNLDCNYSALSIEYHRDEKGNDPVDDLLEILFKIEDRHF